MNTRLDYRGKNIPLFTYTTDMEAWSFSLLAGQTCPGKQLNCNSVCDHCYAHMNAYNLYGTYETQLVRTLWVRAMMRSDAGRDYFVKTMIDGIRALKTDIFRGHDSGDFFSMEYIQCWHEICSALPGVRFWFPTRSYTIPKLLIHLRVLNSLPNVSVRPSAMFFNEDAPDVPGLATGMEVVTTPMLRSIRTRQCPKSITEQGSCEKCGCRACWDKTGKVAFLTHGFAGRRGEVRLVSENMYNCRKEHHRKISLTLAPA